MNAGGVPNLCKSDVPARVQGRRVSNAWGTYLFVGNNVPKGMVIPHETMGWMLMVKPGDRKAWGKERVLRLIS